MTGRAARPGSSPPGRAALPDATREARTVWPDPATQFAQWLGRVRSTYLAVRYTCAHRLPDADLAEPVAVRVVAGLLARPLVFRHFGLPFSGRIATLAEGLLADAAAGRPPGPASWADLEARLHALPGHHREVLLAVCVRGEDVGELARGLGCDERDAARRREATLTHLRDVVAGGLAPRDRRE